MTKLRVTLAAAAAAVLLPAPASAFQVVIGASSARMCYHAAEAKALPSIDSLLLCNEALRGQTPLTDAEIAATYVNRGILRMRRGDVDGAISDYLAARTLDPNEPEIYLNHGTALLKREQAGPALEHFNLAIEKNTLRPALAYYGRAIAHETLGNVRAAYFDYRRASEIDPSWNEPRRELRRFRVQGGG